MQKKLLNVVIICKKSVTIWLQRKIAELYTNYRQKINMEK